MPLSSRRQVRVYFAAFVAAISRLPHVLSRARTGPSVQLLDVCSSWISHYPRGYDSSCGRISGLGMNEEELGRNPILSDFAVQDLNTDPTLPYPDNTFDVVRF
jgi:hypothetical protein